MARTEIDGNLGADAELRFTPNGHAVLNFDVADNHVKRDANGENQPDGVSWHEVAVWGKAAETLAELNLRKGARVFVVGDLRLETFTTREGEERTVSKVKAYKCVPYPPNPNRQAPPAQQRRQSVAPASAPVPEQQWPDEPPF